MINRLRKSEVSLMPVRRYDLRSTTTPYASRGGTKLAKALREFKVDVDGKIALDVGASTGGFTDCLLQHGAARVYAVDVGYGQLDWKLRNHPRVVVFEKTNIRFLEIGALPSRVSLATIDVSFISLKLVLPAVKTLLEPGAEVIALIKPQFEVGKGRVGKGGVVRSPRGPPARRRRNRRCRRRPQFSPAWGHRVAVIGPQRQQGVFDPFKSTGKV